MTVTSIGSSFSYVRPERAARETSAAAEAQETASRPDADSDGDERSASNPASAAEPQRPVTVWAAADELKAALLRVQEARASVSADAAARAYTGH